MGTSPVAIENSTYERLKKYCEKNDKRLFKIATFAIEKYLDELEGKDLKNE